MNIVFIGSSHFGEPALREVLEAGYNISCVVTQPDRKRGRGLHLEGTAIKKAAQALGLKVFQPQSINTKETIDYLASLNPDLIVVIAYGQILGEKILKIPKIFCVNVHASLLPKYRGAGPLNWALINGETKTGITVIKMAVRMDTGPVILQKEMSIAADDNVLTLENKLAQLGKELLLESIALIENKKFSLASQDESQVTLAPKLKKEDGKIKWEKKADVIFNLVRGCFDWPGAYTYYKGKQLKIFKAQVASGKNGIFHPGQITAVLKAGISVATGAGELLIKELQVEGKRRMSADEFIAGHKIAVGEKFGKK